MYRQNSSPPAAPGLTVSRAHQSARGKPGVKGAVCEVQVPHHTRHSVLQEWVFASRDARAELAGFEVGIQKSVLQEADTFTCAPPFSL